MLTYTLLYIVASIRLYIDKSLSIVRIKISSLSKYSFIGYRPHEFFKHYVLLATFKITFSLTVLCVAMHSY
jgi:hypothetical protein